MINLLSAMALPIKIFSGEKKVDDGTGFFLEFRGQSWFISNWHLFAGRKPDNPYIKRCDTPTRISIGVRKIFSGGEFQIDYLEVPLVENNRATWVQHPNGPPYDIVALKIQIDWNRTPLFFKRNQVFQYSFVDDFEWGVSSECFVLGYPSVKGNSKNLPVWKRATVASEPEYDFSALPMFLVDTLTSGGMSGSPVILYKAGSYINNRGVRVMNYSMQQRPIRNVQLIGVYSGRYLEDDPLAPQLGKVWRIAVIDEMLSNPSPGFFHPD